MRGYFDDLGFFPARPARRTGVRPSQDAFLSAVPIGFSERVGGRADLQALQGDVGLARRHSGHQPRRIAGGYAGVFRPVSPLLPAHQPVDEAQLLDDVMGQDERIEIRLTHAAVEAVHRGRQRHPGLDQRIEIGCPVRVELDLHG